MQRKLPLSVTFGDGTINEIAPTLNNKKENN